MNAYILKIYEFEQIMNLKPYFEPQWPLYSQILQKENVFWKQGYNLKYKGIKTNSVEHSISWQCKF